MKQAINVNWAGGMGFSTEINGHKILVDANEEVGGEDKGPRPKALMLMALAGCTGMDVISILKKMRVEIDNFDIAIEAEMSEEHPKVYTKMNIIYKFKGENLSMEKLKKAVDLSQDRYCGVSAMYKNFLELNYDIKIL